MYLVGIDVGGMSIKGGLVTQEGKIVERAVIETKKEYTKEHSISEDIDKVVKLLMKQHNISEDELLGIGIGQPGSIDSNRGVIRYWNNVPMENVPVVEELQKIYNLPIYIDNDANCAALGEYTFGAGKGYKDLLFITLGTGVGSGIIINGKIYGGRAGAGAEAGHMVIVINGEPCNCGRKGCWEAYASATALIKQTTEAMEKDPTSLMHEVAKEEGKISGKTAFVAAKKGDKSGQAVVDQYIAYIAEGLINLANIFRPEVILIGGGISKEKDNLTNPLQKYVNDNCFGSKFNPKVIVKTASLENDAGLLGAAALIINK